MRKKLCTCTILPCALLTARKGISMALKAGVVGAAGYAGAELIRLLLAHPEFELTVITSNADEGQPLTAVYPSFVGACDLAFTRHDNPALKECDAVFMAVPHTAAMAQAPALLEAGVSVFDLSADYRLDSVEVYEAWYNAEHTSPELLKTRAFGLPELFPEGLARIAADAAAGKPVLVACAGCYPTATSLGAAPAVRAGWVDGTVIVDAISGVTGAGKRATQRTHFCSASDNFEAYGVGKHRHTPEIEQILGLKDRLVFTPHLAPINRGLLSTVSMPLSQEARGISLEEVVAHYEAFYADCPFVSVLPAGSLPRTASVEGTNACHIGLALHEASGTLIAISAIDNLCKGAAGQAIQCANLVYGFEETCGLPPVALPV